MSLKKTLSVAAVFLIIATVGAGSSVTVFLEGRFEGPPTIFGPDLVPYAGKTVLLVSGEVGLDETGTVVDYNVTFDAQCVLKNQGALIASGTSFSRCHFLYNTPDGAIILSNPELFSLSLRANRSLTYTATRTVIGDQTDESPYYLDFFQDLYDSGGAVLLSVEHSLDYDSSVFIREMYETNNTLTESKTVNWDGILWSVR